MPSVSSSRQSILERYCTRIGIHHPTFALCIAQLGSSLITVTFMFYYVKVFLNRYHITEGWFQLAQVLFMVWNSINDPLFGYVQDVWGWGWLRSRKKVILYGGPFFALSFLLPWYPWTEGDGPPWLVGMHLIVSLFFYDGFLSFVVLAWCALFAEATTDTESRIRATKYGQCIHILSVNIIAVMEKTSDSLRDMAGFRLTAVFVALIAAATFWYTATYSTDTVSQTTQLNHLLNNASDDDIADSKSSEDQSNGGQTVVSNMRDGLRLTREVVGETAFVRVTAVNFLHICRSTLLSNFAAIFVEALVPRSILPLGTWRIGLFYATCSVLPQLLVVLCSGVLSRYGPENVLKLSFVWSIVFGFAVFVCGFGNPYIVMLFMLVDCINVFPFLPYLSHVFFSDIVDRDMVKHNRRSPLSSLVFSLNALFTKPAQSLAPMVLVAVLSQYGYANISRNAALTTTTFSPELSVELKYAMFSCMCLSSITLACCELVVFKGFRLRNLQARRGEAIAVV